MRRETVKAFLDENRKISSRKRPRTTEDWSTMAGGYGPPTTTQNLPSEDVVSSSNTVRPQSGPGGV